MITEIQIEHCADLAKLHLTHLRTPFRGKPGEALLKHYYQAICKGKGACGYIVQQDGQILGYVCGVWDPALLQKTMLRHFWFQLGFWALLQILLRPALVIDFLSRFRKADKISGSNEPGYELRPIVVVPEARGTGIASALVKKLISDADQRGYSKIHLYTERDNLAANSFYRKFGFALVRQETRAGEVYLHYELPTYL